jgi:hypothetical protein
MVRIDRARYQGPIGLVEVKESGAVSREDIMRRLELLRIEHRDLDSAIAALVLGGGGDQMQVARLKKRKLRLRDEIAILEDALVPDIIA